MQVKKYWKCFPSPTENSVPKIPSLTFWFPDYGIFIMKEVDEPVSQNFSSKNFPEKWFCSDEGNSVWPNLLCQGAALLSERYLGRVILFFSHILWVFLATECSADEDQDF